MGYVGNVKIGSDTHLVGSTLYGTCSTAAATAEKVVTCANFTTLITGVTIHVKFTNSNTVANPTLNVNSTGAKNIYRYGTTAPSTSEKTSWQAGAVVSFTYDGTNWIMNDWLNNDTTYTAASATPNAVSSAGAVGTSSKYAREDHTHAITVAIGDGDGQVKIAGQNASVKNCALKSDITTLQTNFQAGVDSVYNAVVAKGSTPASKSLSDVVAGISAIPNVNSGTSPTTYTSNGTKDLGVNNSYRYIKINVPNSNSGTYAPTGKSTYDMGASNTYRYVDTRSVTNVNTETYTATSKGTFNMGVSNEYRYLDTRSVPNVNSGTYTTYNIKSIQDMGAANTYRYLNLAFTELQQTSQNRVEGTGSRSVTFSLLTTGTRYLLISLSIPTIVNCGQSGTCSLTAGTSENILAHENKGGTGRYYQATQIGIVKPASNGNITIKHQYGTNIYVNMCALLIRLPSNT